MRLALCSKKKLGFGDGTIPILENDLNKEELWWEINTLVNLWILNIIELGLRSFVNYSEGANKLWADLKEIFLVGNGSRKYESKVALENYKKGRDTVNAYYSH